MSREKTATRMRNYVIIFLFMVGVALTFIAITADYIPGLDLTPGFGVVQMFQFLLGVTCLTLAAFVFGYNRRQGAPRSLQADIGVRLAATGLVFAYVAGLSDLIGIGTHVQPRFERPFVGPLQAGGILLGLLSILFGLFLYYTSRGSRASSSLEFLANGKPEAGNQ
jgi:hypothetical protein